MSNILPKKSWHVYNDDNREKVRKDEVAQKIENEKIEQRAKAAERDYRLSLLRNKDKIYENIMHQEEEKPTEISKTFKDYVTVEKFELFKTESEISDEIKYNASKSTRKTSLSLDKKTKSFSHERDDPLQGFQLKNHNNYYHDSKYNKQSISVTTQITNKSDILLTKRLEREAREREREENLYFNKRGRGAN